MRALFVTGTDTGVGKTVISTLLVKYMSSLGLRVAVQKWIKTGCRNLTSSFLLPYSFRVPCSPHLASQLERRKINPEKIKKSFRQLARKFDFVIVEGIGGALVPFNKKRLVIDMAKELDLPVLLVAQNKLGAINHTLLTIEALKSRNLKLIGLVFNNKNYQDKRILRDNPLIVKTLTKVRVFGVLPWKKKKEELSLEFSPIAKKIIRGFSKTILKPS